MISWLHFYERDNLVADHTHGVFDLCKERLWTSRDAQEHLLGFDFDFSRRMCLCFSDRYGDDLPDDAPEWFKAYPRASLALAMPGPVWKDFSWPDALPLIGIEANSEDEFRFHQALDVIRSPKLFPSVEQGSEILGWTTCPGPIRRLANGHVMKNAPFIYLALISPRSENSKRWDREARAREERTPSLDECT
jgi:hypothetical protein